MSGPRATSRDRLWCVWPLTYAATRAFPLIRASTIVRAPLEFGTCRTGSESSAVPRGLTKSVYRVRFLLSPLRVDHTSVQRNSPTSRG